MIMGTFFSLSQLTPGKPHITRDAFEVIETLSFNPVFAGFCFLLFFSLPVKLYRKFEDTVDLPAICSLKVKSLVIRLVFFLSE